MARILIADDEDLERRALAYIISKASQEEPYTLEEARNGPEALSKAMSGIFDVLFLDIKMPGMDGIEVAERLKAAGIQTAIVIVSAYDTFEYAQKAIRLGVYEYLLKPASREEVLQALSRSLELQRAPESLARLKRESLSAITEASARLEELLLGEMKKGELGTTTVRDYERLAALQGLPKAVLAFRIEAGREKAPEQIERALLSGLTAAAVAQVGSGFRVLKAESESEAFILLYGLPTAPLDFPNDSAMGHEATAQAPFKVGAGFARHLNGNPLKPLIESAQRTLRELSPFTLLCGFAGPSMEGTELIFSRALEACRLASSECPLVCLSPAENEKKDEDSSLAREERSRPNLAQRALDVIKAGYARDIGLESLAGELGVNPFHLSHAISKEFGMGFSELLQRMRIQKAKEILLGGGSAKEASYLVGFTDQAYFSRVFKKLEGITPGEYSQKTAKKYNR